MLKSRPKKLFHFLLFFGASIILLLCLNLTVNFLTLPNVSVWIKQNPDRSFLAEKHDIPRNVIKYQYLPINQAPQTLLDCFILAEDASFYVHEGIDWFEFRQSLIKNIRAKKFSRGASTITQQVVKNLFLSNDKKLSRKIREILITRKIEKELRKRRILELYINIAEFGPNIYGVRAAAKYYFGKVTAELSLSEMVQLTAVLPSPRRLSPVKLNKSLKWRCRIITERLYFYRKINEMQYLELKQLYHK